MKAQWIVLKAAFSNVNGGLEIEGTNEAAQDLRDRRIVWNIGEHSLRNGAWKRYDWSNTEWADARATATFERFAGVSIDEARRAHLESTK